MRRAPFLLLFALLIGVAGCNQYRNGAGEGPALSAAPEQSVAAEPASAGIYSGTLPFEGKVFNLGCKAEVPVSGSLAITVDLGKKPSFQAVGDRTFGPGCFNHTDNLSLKGSLKKVAEGRYSYQRDSKNDTYEITVIEDRKAGTATVTYDNAHHCCGKPDQGNEGNQAGSAVLNVAR